MKQVIYLEHQQLGEFKRIDVERKIAIDNTSFWHGNLFYARRQNLVIKVLSREDIISIN